MGFVCNAWGHYILETSQWEVREKYGLVSPYFLSSMYNPIMISAVYFSHCFREWNSANFLQNYR